MSKLSDGQKIIIIILTILIIILAFLMINLATNVVDNIERDKIKVDIETEEVVTLGSILKEYDVHLIKRDGSRIYVKFNRELYNEDGSSNEEFFYNLINDLVVHLKTTFYLIDEENNIDIKVFYMNNDNPTIRINNQDDFYSVTDGKTYLDVANVDIVESTNIMITEDSMDAMYLYGMNFPKYIQRYGEPIGQDENGYYLFDDGNIKIAKYDNSKNIKNIIYSEKYLNSFVFDITENYSLDKVVEAYGESELGSISEGYLGYRNSDFYIFFLEDEISIYPYGYERNTKLEEYLESYEISLNLNELQKRLRTLWDGYFEFEFDEERKYLLLTYPTKGVKIEIIDGSTKNVTFYSNYYFSDELKEKIRNGYYTINADEDFLDITEIKRIISN